MTISKIPVWLDCDPGHDDTVALLLALHHPSIDLIGVSTTHGNASLKNTTHNALSMMSVFNRDPNRKVPVYAGCISPLTRQPNYAPGIHGANGLGGIELPEPTQTTENEFGDEEAFLDALYEATKKYKGQLALVPVGPLTNAARLFRKYPDARENIKVLSIMGGGYNIGNIGDGAEFNIYDDATAANEIFTDLILAPKTVLVPLDVTHTVICTDEIQDRILEGGSPLRVMLKDLMTFFADTYKKQQTQFALGAPVHDPVAVYVLLEEYGIDNVGIKAQKYAMSVIEQGPQEGKILFTPDENGSKVVFGINVPKFWDDLLAALAKADKQ